MKNRSKSSASAVSSDKGLIFTDDLSFAALEAYKLLRTNIMFSFPGDASCRVVGISSSVRGEGKSTTACNLAYVLSQAGKKTLLIDGDLRLPSVFTKLSVKQSPGLSNLLVSKSAAGGIISCKSAPGLDILPSGDCPPNPSELLSSERMGQLLDAFKSSYEYIVVDLPPISDVTDALAISKFLDGIVMVVRNGVVDKSELADALRQLRLCSVRLLGFAFRDAAESKKGYGKKYGKYYKDYYSAGGKKRLTFTPTSCRIWTTAAEALRSPTPCFGKAQGRALPSWWLPPISTPQEKLPSLLLSGVPMPLTVSVSPKTFRKFSWAQRWHIFTASAVVNPLKV